MWVVSEKFFFFLKWREEQKRVFIWWKKFGSGIVGTNYTTVRETHPHGAREKQEGNFFFFLSRKFYFRLSLSLSYIHIWSGRVHKNNLTVLLVAKTHFFFFILLTLLQLSIQSYTNKNMKDIYILKSIYAIVCINF